MAISIDNKFSPFIIRILGCNPGVMTLQGTNTYLIGKGAKRILIDTGEGNKPTYVKGLKGVLQKERCHIEHIIITHWHYDHIGGLKDVLNAMDSTNCTVWKYPRTNAIEERGRYGTDIQPLRDEQHFTLEGCTLTIKHTPGHTSDHVSLLLEEENALFSGDCVLGGGSTSIFENLYDYMLSLNRIRDMRVNIIYPGHGPVIYEPEDAVMHYIEHRNQREMEIINVMGSHPKKPWTREELVAEIYKSTPEELRNMAAVNVLHHLEKLQKENKVTVDGEKWSLITQHNM